MKKHLQNILASMGAFIFAIAALMIAKMLYKKGLMEIKPGLKLAFVLFDWLCIAGITVLCVWMLKTTFFK